MKDAAIQAPGSETSHRDLRLRLAIPADLGLLRHWHRQPHVQAAFSDSDDDSDGDSEELDPDGGWAWESELARPSDGCERLIAELPTRPIGFLQIMDPALDRWQYWGDCPPNLRSIDIWIGRSSDLGRGFGTRMMELALERCFAPASVEAVIIDPLQSRTRVHRFYERLGFEFVERRLLQGADTRVYRLERERWRRRSR